MTKELLNHRLCPAKTYIDHQGNNQLGFNVSDHTFIVGKVAKSMMDIIPDFMGDFFPKGTELVVACHDIGKVSPTFYLKLCSHVLTKEHLPCEVVDKYFHNKDNENQLWGGHATVSAITLKEVLNDKYIYKIVGSHHGALHPNLRLYDFDGFDFGGEAWHQMRVEVIEELKQRLSCDFPKITSDIQAKILSGFTTVADWIGSGGCLAQPTENWQQELDQNVQRTLADAGFHALDIKKNLSFDQLFGAGFSPNTMQSLIHEHGVINGLNIIEAPMGGGKTESALYFAYKCLNLDHATGIYFALPTQLTSNMIYGRFNEFLGNVLNNTHQKSQLSHANAFLIKTTMGEEGAVGGSWFDGNKRTLLAPYGVGTIDQALLSVINVRHNFVRSFGLAGKVVILDEVHSYDVFTGLLLDEMIKQLLDMKCTVIILSATLTKSRREQLIPQSYNASLQSYPLITTYNPDTKEVKEHAFEMGVPDKIVHFALSGRQDCYQEALHRLAQGQYVLWIENTVNEAIDTFHKFQILAHESGFDCGLLHSKFIIQDRQNIEQTWVSAFGKHNPDRYRGGGKILIGTQILEQSLDIDADYMVSNLAPMDLLLQRTGRLWRHNRPYRPAKQCDFHIIASPYNNCFQSIDKLGASAFVYYPYVLLKTLRVLELYHEQQDTLVLPKVIPELLESTYSQSNPVIESELKGHLDTMFNGDKTRLGVNSLRQKALANISKFGMPISKDDEAKTRNIDEESFDMIVLKDLISDGKSISKVCLVNGDILDITHHSKDQKGFCLTLLNQTVKVNLNKINRNLTQEPLPKSLAILGRKHASPLICIMDANGDLVLWNGKVLSEKYSFNYSSVMGLITKKMR